jgi:hypothetical protein
VPVPPHEQHLAITRDDGGGDRAGHADDMLLVSLAVGLFDINEVQADPWAVVDGPASVYCPLHADSSRSGPGSCHGQPRPYGFRELSYCVHAWILFQRADRQGMQPPGGTI